jgi:hypothetical protein
MSKIALLLRDLPVDIRRTFAVRSLLTKEQWDEIIATRQRGVSERAIFAALSGVVTPFFSSEKQLKSALSNERTARRKAANK